ncbi:MULTISPECIES: hypothetical protein [Burkholderia]|jgi:hypothetical protein|uniref:hypothetical protein n=1 Tax=Burkholderia TaxID=32008 RepID=UPI0012B14A0E|nr:MULTISPECIES: hypothetical protein [Burkholderia]MBG0868375.1 hypothetical protein [Burkholderia sp. 9777_1386]MBJ9698252.1 hypothetical protein [Burkholderia cenocepacia]MBN3532959.1 hypothetical protein [Burkholderia cenocepacia]MBO1859211.1 hypothetical protein [Burkholderia cenocepacia]MBR7906988.1 hypothetical protein [Burkholderia cenocepacia]
MFDIESKRFHKGNADGTGIVVRNDRRTCVRHPPLMQDYQLFSSNRETVRGTHVPTMRESVQE